jgi:hypothetical protein
LLDVRQPKSVEVCLVLEGVVGREVRAQVQVVLEFLIEVQNSDSKMKL